MGTLEAGSRYEILYDQTEGEVDIKAMGGVRTRTIRAGETLELEVFPLINVSAPAREEYRRRKSSPAQVELNRRNSEKRIRRLCEANFGTGDIVMHPTFDYGFEDYSFSNPADRRAEFDRMGLPIDESDARRKFKNFIDRVKRFVKKCGKDPKELKYLYVLEKTKEPRDEDINALPPHFHFHAIISGMDGCLTIEKLNELWGHGYTRAEPVNMRFNGLKGFTTYISKRINGRNGRKLRWGHSKGNLTEPEVKVSDRRISRTRLAKIARDVMSDGKEILEKLYPEYRLEEVPVVKYSDFVAGAYIYARMRRR